MEILSAFPGKPAWASALRYVAQLHVRSTHAPRHPFPFAWEEIGPGYISSPAFGHWDIVHQILDALPHDPGHARHQILNNLVCQTADGIVPGTIWLKSGEARWSVEVTHPPVWPVAVDEWTAVTGSLELVRYCYLPLKRQIMWFEQNRAARPAGFYYTDILNKHWESGVDEGVRFDLAPPGPLACMDATAHLYGLYETAARWGELTEAGDTEVQAHKARATVLCDFVQNELFDEESGWFFDIWAMEDAALRRLALEGMWPMVTGAASVEQAHRVIDNLLDPARFFTPHPPASVAICEPSFELRMWRGPTWNSMALWAARGCVRYGRPEAAARLLEAALDSTARQFEQTGEIWEFYHPYGGDNMAVQRKPDTESNTPFTDYLGHNPLIAMANLWEQCTPVGSGSLPATMAVGVSRA